MLFIAKLGFIIFFFLTYKGKNACMEKIQQLSKEMILRLTSPNYDDLENF